ncbi:MAG: hypothetical protein JW714_01485, partial [Candidatus Omnitrophica bacterium]|nr:hypothetical protein [Candidatus Omnitrophota bacterium]
SSDGSVKEVKIIEEDSSPNRLLKGIAQRSLLQAAPFLPFPEGLSQKQLSFNVMVSFELEN